MQDQRGTARNMDLSKRHKRCSVCREPIQWRRWRARNWEELSYCSASCRRAASDRARSKVDVGQKTYDHLSTGSSAAA